jgi:hypothetical protein
VETGIQDVCIVPPLTRRAPAGMDSCFHGNDGAGSCALSSGQQCVKAG